MSDRWDHTAPLLTLIANVNRDPKKQRPFRPEDFHPFRKRTPAGVRITRRNIGLLKRAFIDREVRS